MRFGLINGIRTDPAPRLTGICALCGRAMIPKCGRYVRWHWAHKSRAACDPWREPETEWHLNWKDCFPLEYQEVVHIDEKTGEKHIADVTAASGVVVEVQHSPIAEEELRSREEFYGDMFWIVDARNLFGYFALGTSRDLVTWDPMAYGFQWISRSRLLKKWSVARKTVYLDTLFRNSYTPFVETHFANHVLWRLLEFNPDNGLGSIAPVPSDWVVKAVLDGTPVPLMRCERSEARRYRRNLVEVDY